MRLFNDDILKYVKRIAYGKSYKDITAKVNKKFEKDFTITQVSNFMKRNNIKTGRTGRFEKGSTPWNKGTKGLTSANRTSFKKGYEPKNIKPIGHERHSSDGYTRIKVRNERADKNYVLKHRYVWQKHHQQEIPEDHVLVFLDGDTRNTDIDNLKLVSRAAAARVNHGIGLTDDKELNEAIYNLGEIMTKIGKENVE